MTRAERALDRLERHSEFVIERRERGIEEAVYLADREEAERLILRRDSYADLVARETNDIEKRLAAYARHLRDLEKPDHMKKRARRNRR